MKRFLSLSLAVVIVFSLLLSGCGYKDITQTLKVNASEDNYRNVYQIFVNSFADSNDDGVGDIKGIISKLDYLNDGNPDTDTDLGIDAIWLTPIMPSPSYHKYDVTDYYNIDETFGTLEDFDQLVTECKKRGINIIMDMVLNHCSSNHPWFEKACSEVLEGNVDGYAKYFDIKYYGNDGPVNPQGYTEIGNGYWYESNFSPTMPEWNLNSEATREEFSNIAKFWIDRGVSGFRLDAVKYFTNSETDGEKFLEWYNSMCKNFKDDFYLVGENWSDSGDIFDIYNSGIDSQFCFKYATTSGGIINAVRTEKSGSIADKIAKYNDKMLESNSKAINAMFLSNHDMVRSGNALESKGVSYEKMAASLYMLFPGNSFIYYGEEIGMTALKTDKDTYYRAPMVWDSDNMPSITVNGVDTNKFPTFGGVSQQEDDKYSLLNFYKRIIKIKNQNPEIARGKITGSCDFDDENVVSYFIEDNNAKLLVIHNLSSSDEKNLEITSDMMTSFESRGELVASATDENNQSHIMLSGNTLKMPPQSSVILLQK